MKTVVVLPGHRNLLLLNLLQLPLEVLHSQFRLHNKGIPRRIIFRHILPNAMGPIIVNATLTVAVIS